MPSILTAAKLEIGNTSLVDVDLTPVESLIECVFDGVDAVDSLPLLTLFKYIVMEYTKLAKFKFWSTMRLSNENGWAPLFIKLGRLLKTLGLCDYTSGQQLTLLNDSECRIKHLDIDCRLDTALSQLAVSNQIRYIQTLVLGYEQSRLRYVTKTV